MYLIDTHAHLSFEQFNEDIEAVIRRANIRGIKKFCIPNINQNTISSIEILCKKYPSICFPMIGLHPSCVFSNYKKNLHSIYKKLKLRNVPYIAIGEIGIDLHLDSTYLKEQKEAFKKQLLWSIEYNLPIVMHVRNSFPFVFECLFDVGIDRLRGVFHCFGENKEYLEKIFLYKNFMIGIGGTITYKNANYHNNLSLFPIERILLETDSPYLSPVPLRGKRNEPSYLIYTARKVAEIYNLPIEKIIKKTTKNAIGLFSI